MSMNQKKIKYENHNENIYGLRHDGDFVPML